MTIVAIEVIIVRLVETLKMKGLAMVNTKKWNAKFIASNVCTEQIRFMNENTPVSYKYKFLQNFRIEDYMSGAKRFLVAINGIVIEFYYNDSIKIYITLEPKYPFKHNLIPIEECPIVLESYIERELNNFLRNFQLEEKYLKEYLQKQEAVNATRRKEILLRNWKKFLRKLSYFPNF